MINQFEVPMYLEDALPDISKDLKKNVTPGNAYQSIHVFLDYTFAKIKEHNVTAARECFDLADKLYCRGNKTVQNAVENIYVYSLSHLPTSDAAEKKLLLSMVP